MEKRERDIESGLRRSVERMGGKFMKRVIFICVSSLVFHVERGLVAVTP